MGLQRADQDRRPSAFDGTDRRRLRQRHDGGVLGANADRVAERRRWRTRLELANAIFEYLEIFHNRKRRHSSLGMLTPTEYETLHQPVDRRLTRTSTVH